MLEGRSTYEALPRDPTKKIKEKDLKITLEETVGKHKDNSDHLIPTASIMPCIYGTPKIDKMDTLLHALVYSIGAATYSIFKALVKILKPLLGKTEHHRRSPIKLSQDLKDIKAEKDEIFI